LDDLELSYFKGIKIAREIFKKMMTDIDSIGHTPSSLERYLVSIILAVISGVFIHVILVRAGGNG